MGLSEIELYDENCSKILLSGSLISIKHSPNSSDSSKLVNGIKFTTDEKDMWTSSLPINSKHIRICLKVSVDQTVCGIKIWNYNKPESLNKGVKDAEVWLNHEKV